MKEVDISSLMALATCDDTRCHFILAFQLHSKLIVVPWTSGQRSACPAIRSVN